MSNGLVVGYGLLKELPEGYNYANLEDRLLDYDLDNLAIVKVGDLARDRKLAVAVTLERVTYESSFSFVSEFGVLMSGSDKVELDFEEKKEFSTAARILEVGNNPEWFVATWNY